MVGVHGITNTIFTSRTYILHKEGCARAWLVDIGDIDPVVDFLEGKGLFAAGVLVTHAHFDHIYGLPALAERYPGLKVFISSYSKEALASDRLNLSRYAGMAMRYAGDNVSEVGEGDTLELFEGEPAMTFHLTPGHNPGCLTMVLGDAVFTGDAYIPGIAVNLKLPHSDKEAAARSLERIIALSEGKRIFSGHEI